MKYEYGIKILTESLPAKTLMEIKRVTGLSPAETKRAVSAGEPVYGCACSDDDGLALIIELYDSLGSQGVAAEACEDDQPKDIQLFRNLLESWRETSREYGLDKFEF